MNVDLNLYFSVPLISHCPFGSILALFSTDCMIGVGICVDLFVDEGKEGRGVLSY